MATCKQDRRHSPTSSKAVHRPRKAKSGSQEGQRIRRDGENLRSLGVTLMSSKLYKTKCCRNHAGCLLGCAKSSVGRENLNLHHFQFLELNSTWMAAKHEMRRLRKSKMFAFKIIVASGNSLL